MDDDSSDSSDRGRSFWSGLRTFLFCDDSEATLRDEIEEAIESREGEVPRVGDLSNVERQMLRNILHFGEKTAGDVAVPRGDIIAVPATMTFEGLVAAFTEAGHSRLPVYEEDLDTVIIDGEPVMGLNRIPADGEARSNMHVGGRPELSPCNEHNLLSNVLSGGLSRGRWSTS